MPPPLFFGSLARREIRPVEPARLIVIVVESIRRPSRHAAGAAENEHYHNPRRQEKESNAPVVRVQFRCPFAIVRNVSCMSRDPEKSSRCASRDASGSSWTIGAAVTELIRVSGREE